MQMNNGLNSATYVAANEKFYGVTARKYVREIRK